MKKVITLVLSLVYLFFASVTVAETLPTNTPSPKPTPCPTTVSCPIDVNIVQPVGTGIAADTPLGTIIGNLTTIILSIAALVVLIMIIWGGLEWIFSSGDKEKIAKARDRIIHALVGLAIIALAFLIAKVVGQLVNIDLLNLKLPPLGPRPQ